MENDVLNKEEKKELIRRVAKGSVNVNAIHHLKVMQICQTVLSECDDDREKKSLQLLINYAKTCTEKMKNKSEPN